MCNLHDQGLPIHPENTEETVTIKFRVFCGSVDLQAKAYVLNQTMHDCGFDCSTCEEEGVEVVQGRGDAKYYPFTPAENQPE